MTNNPYANDRRVQSHVQSNRQRAWSESTCTSLLSNSESDASFQSGSGFMPRSLVDRPLPDIPAESSTGQVVRHDGAQVVVTQRSESVQRRNSSAKRKRKKSARKSHRKTLIFLSISAIVFSLFCLSLLAATFFRHGIWPWGDVVPNFDVAKSCQPYGGQLKSFVQGKASAKRSNAAFSLLPSGTYCRPLAFQYSNGSSYTLKEQTGNNRLTIAQSGLYYVTLMIEITMDARCELGPRFQKINFELNHESLNGCNSTMTLSLQFCEPDRKDNPRIFCLGEMISLTKGDELAVNLTIPNYGPFIQIEQPVYLRVIQLFET